MSFTETVPWFMPGALLAVIVSVLARRELARALAVWPSVATLLVVSVGLILAATLTPLRNALEEGAAGSGSCDLARIGLPSPEEVIRFGSTDIVPNVLLFVPLGIAIGIAPRSWKKLMLLTIAIAAPALIESAQLVVTALARGCESADVVDNLLGLTIGLAIGTAVGVIQNWGRGRAP